MCEVLWGGSTGRAQYFVDDGRYSGPSQVA